jgi:hypothetical protein
MITAKKEARPVYTNRAPNLETILSQLSKVKKQGSGFIALCPGHDDKVRSLSIKEGNDGKILLFCHSGCRTADVLNSIGLEFRNLFTDGR